MAAMIIVPRGKVANENFEEAMVTFEEGEKVKVRTLKTEGCGTRPKKRKDGKSRSLTPRKARGFGMTGEGKKGLARRVARVSLFCRWV
ncbi:MAG TPA: hypothetical protein VOA78_11685 [Candidatus Dormibacteraeota bacterium]|nr:hypothetical protein [Candidatus Dormibacteraeota bacterium]